MDDAITQLIMFEWHKMPFSGIQLDPAYDLIYTSFGRIIIVQRFFEALGRKMTRAAIVDKGGLNIPCVSYL